MAHKSPEQISERMYISALISTIPYVTCSTLPFAYFTIQPDAPSRLAAFIFAAGGTAYLRYHHKTMRNSFNEMSGTQKYTEGHVLYPLSQNLNSRPDEDLKLSLQDLNPLRHPFTTAIGVSVGLATADPALGLAAAAKSSAIRELGLLAVTKVRSLQAYLKSSLG